MLVVTGAAFPGESGSLALSMRGTAIGVLHRREDPDVNKILFTLMSTGHLLFAKLGASEELQTFLDGLESGVLNRSSKFKLKTLGFSNLELLKMFEMIKSAPKSYVKGLAEFRKAIWDHFVCNGLRDYAWKFAEIAFAALREAGIPLGTEKIPSSAVLVPAEAAYDTFRSLALVNAPTNVQAERLGGALRLMKLYEAQGDLRNARISPAFRASVFLQYAQMLFDFARLGVGGRDVRSKFVTALDASITLNPDDWRPYALAAQHFEAEGKHELAARAAATASHKAREFYSARVPNQEHLERIWFRNFVKAAADTPYWDDVQLRRFGMVLDTGIKGADVFIPAGGVIHEVAKGIQDLPGG